MIRAALVIIVFLGVTLTLILTQPGMTPVADAPRFEDEAMVTRAQNNFASMATFEAIEATLSEPDTPSVTMKIAPATTAVDEVEPVTADAALTDSASLEALIVQAVREGRSEDYILDLVKRATATDPAVDSAASVEETPTNAFLSLLNNEEISFAGPATHMDQVYVVQPGDSLASIAAYFYDDSSAAFDIFMANRTVMGSPDNFVVGQELIIPAR